MVGPTLGPTLGGYITDAFGWPWIFYINIPIGMLALALSLSFIQNSRYQVKAEQVDYPGLLLLAIGIGTLQTMLERGDRKSTRLNSSHGYISYAVFCLKKTRATH